MHRSVCCTLALGMLLFVTTARDASADELPLSLSRIAGQPDVAVMPAAEAQHVRGEFNTGIIATLHALTHDGQFTGQAGGQRVLFHLTDRGSTGVTVSAATAGTASLSGAPKVIGTIQSNVSSQFVGAINAAGNISTIKATLLPGQFTVDFR